MASSRRLNLLVVDDDPSIVRLVTRVVERTLPEKIVCTGLADSREAHRWLDSHCCDILLSDVQMPGIGGLELLRLAKRRNAWTQVIFMTAFSTWDLIAEAIENGASDYLLKPLDIEDLTTVLAQEYQRVARWQSAVIGTLCVGHAAAE